MTIWKNIMWLALCLYFECRGEPQNGKVAVAHVIMNRVQRRDLSIEDVVKQPWQFSWLNPGAPRPKADDFASLGQCFDAAMTCLSERLEGKDFFNSDHYYADYIPPPVWADSLKFIKQIGRHRFYRS